jgi:hypothetical protein
MRGNRSNDSIFERVLSDLICPSQFSKPYLKQKPVPLQGRAFLFYKEGVTARPICFSKKIGLQCRKFGTIAIALTLDFIFWVLMKRYP